MSNHTSSRRITIPDLQAKKGNTPIVALTAYVAPFAALLDLHTDMLLVGDSLGMVLYGMDSTLPVTLDDMIRHGRTVVHATRHACIIVDMPFGSYQTSPQQAYDNAVRIMKETGAQGIKLEGGAEMQDTIRFITQRGIPVMAHIGLKPQHVHSMGGYRWQGRDKTQQDVIMQDATCHEKAGAFALLLEGVDATLAYDITHKVNIPTIGIGAGVHCDGQILVTEDMAGLSESAPKFVRQFGAIGTELTNAAQDYANAVKDKQFPDDSESYRVNTP